MAETGLAAVRRGNRSAIEKADRAARDIGAAAAIFAVFVVERCRRTLADQDIRQPVEFLIAEMARLGAQETVARDLGDLLGHLGPRLDGVEGGPDEAAHGRESQARIDQAAAQHGGCQRTQKDDADRDRIEPVLLVGGTPVA